MRTTLRRLRRAGLAIAISLLPAGLALAHAEIQRCEPSPGASLSTPPAEVRCWFTEELDPKGSTLAVTDAAGNPVDRGDGRVDLNDPDRKQMAASLDPTRLKPGTYTVRWRTRSAEDGDVAEGSFTFTLLPAPASPAGPTATPSPSPAPTPTPLPSTTPAPPPTPSPTPAPASSGGGGALAPWAAAGLLLIVLIAAGIWRGARRGRASPK